MRIPYHGTPPISEKLTDPLQAFPHYIHPLSQELFPSDPLSLEYYGDLYALSLFLFFSSGSGNMCTYFTTNPQGTLPQICNVIRALSPFLWRLLKAQETWTYKSYPLFLNLSGSFWKTPHVSGDLFKNTLFSVFFPSGKIFLRQTAKNTPFPEKMGIRMHAAPLYIQVGGGGGCVSHSLICFYLSLSVCLSLYLLFSHLSLFSFSMIRASVISEPLLGILMAKSLWNPFIFIQCSSLLGLGSMENACHSKIKSPWAAEL